MHPAEHNGGGDPQSAGHGRRGESQMTDGEVAHDRPSLHDRSAAATSIDLTWINSEGCSTPLRQIRQGGDCLRPWKAGSWRSSLPEDLFDEWT